MPKRYCITTSKHSNIRLSAPTVPPCTGLPNKTINLPNKTTTNFPNKIANLPSNNNTDLPNRNAASYSVSPHSLSRTDLLNNLPSNTNIDLPNTTTNLPNTTSAAPSSQIRTKKHQNPRKKDEKEHYQSSHMQHNCKSQRDLNVDTNSNLTAKSNTRNNKNTTATSRLWLAQHHHHRLVQHHPHLLELQITRIRTTTAMWSRTRIKPPTCPTAATTTTCQTRTIIANQKTPGKITKDPNHPPSPHPNRNNRLLSSPTINQN